MKKHSERIMLTNNCNFNCSYCYQTKKNTDSLDINILIKRLEYLKQKLDSKEIDEMNISLFGGEPLLNWEGFKLILNTLGQYDNVYIATITNGFLIDEEKIKEFQKAKHFTLDISLDGQFEANKCRTPNIKDYNKTIDNIKLLGEKNFHFSIRPTITKHNFKSILQDIKYFYNFKCLDSIVLQFANYKEISVDDKSIEKLLKIIPFLNRNNPPIFIGLLNNFNKDREELSEVTFVTYEKELAYELWYIFQVNGLIYSKLICMPTGVEDFDQYLFSLDEDFANYNIHSITNLNDEIVIEKIIYTKKYLINKYNGMCNGN